MKWACGRTSRLRHEAKKRPHKWFAWFPVKVGQEDCRWLEVVERQLMDRWDSWEGDYEQYSYRPLSGDSLTESEYIGP